MARPKFKKKCALCKKAWAVVSGNDFPICDSCGMKQISEQVTDPAYSFLKISDDLYRKSSFLRDIKRNYLMYKNLTEKQIEAFKKVVSEMQSV